MDKEEKHIMTLFPNRNMFGSIQKLNGKYISIKIFEKVLMDEETYGKLINFFNEMEADTLNPFYSEAKMPEEYKSEWNQNFEEPKYLNVIRSYIESGELVYKEYIMELFNNYILRSEEFIKTLEGAEIFLALFYEFKNKYLKKLLHILLDEGTELKCIEYSLKKMDLYFKYFNHFESSDFEYNMEKINYQNHVIPNKLYP